MIACGGTLPVLFSAQLSPPKHGGSEGMTLWTRWMDNTGSYEIPDHALVISKGRSKRYYALVCASENSIASLRYQPCDDQKFRNYPDGACPGNSQNTALLTGSRQADHTSGRYQKGFSATLISPWLVTLAGPRLLTTEEQNQVARWNGEDYSGLVRCIRGCAH